MICIYIQECMYLVTCRQRHGRDHCGDGEVKVAHGLNACGNQGILQAPQAKVTCCRALDDIVEDCRVSIHSQDSPENRILPVGFDASAKATFAWSKYARESVGC